MKFKKNRSLESAKAEVEDWTGDKFTDEELIAFTKEMAKFVIYGTDSSFERDQAVAAWRNQVIERIKG